MKMRVLMFGGAFSALQFVAYAEDGATRDSSRSLLQLGSPFFEAHTEDASPSLRSSQTASSALPETQAEALTYYDHGEPTDYEQLMLELVNRARMAPGDEAALFGIDLNEGLAPGTIEDTPKPPLAPNTYLTDSSRLHSAWMLDADIFSHTGEGGSTPTERMEAAGYDLSGSYTTGENVAWTGTTGTVDLEAMTLKMHEGLFKSSGHRKNICKESFQEIGIGILEGLFYKDGTDWKAGMTTQNFATSSTTPGPFITGVVYEDDNGNDTYDFGEGLEGVEVTLSGSGYYAETSASGGYALPFDGALGSEEVTFTGPDWDESKMVTLVSGENLKVDLIVEEVAAVWYDAASHILPSGWRYFDWFKGFKPDGPNWIYHGRHGWLYVIADDTSGMFLWDVAIGRWMYTNETIYPWMYAYGAGGGWVYFFEGGSPGARYFKRGDNAEVVSEQDLSL